MFSLEILIPLVTLMGLTAGLFEWRIRVMQTQFKEKLLDRDTINKIVQDNLEKKIDRLEAKIDMLLNFQCRLVHNDQKDE